MFDTGVCDAGVCDTVVDMMLECVWCCSVCGAAVCVMLWCVCTVVCDAVVCVMLMCV